jgi:hypothetical protein
MGSLGTQLGAFSLLLVLLLGARGGGAQCSGAPEGAFTCEGQYNTTGPSACAIMGRIARGCVHAANVTILGRSAEGRDVCAMTIAPAPDGASATVVRVQGLIHGDEPTGRFLALALAEGLCDGSILLPAVQVNLVPEANPDGWVHQVRCASGVDLNRDFPSRWEPDATEEGSPEARALMAWVRGAPAQAGLSLHEGFVACSYAWESLEGEELAANPWGGLDAPAPGRDAGRAMCQAYVDAHPTMRESTYPEGGLINGAKWYPLQGTYQDWAQAVQGSQEVTLELYESPVCLPAERMAANVEAALPALLAAISHARDASVGGHVRVVDPVGELHIPLAWVGGGLAVAVASNFSVGAWSPLLANASYRILLDPDDAGRARVVLSTRNGSVLASAWAGETLTLPGEWAPAGACTHPDADGRGTSSQLLLVDGGVAAEREVACGCCELLLLGGGVEGRCVGGLQGLEALFAVAREDLCGNGSSPCAFAAALALGAPEGLAVESPRGLGVLRASWVPAGAPPCPPEACGGDPALDEDLDGLAAGSDPDCAPCGLLDPFTPRDACCVCGGGGACVTCGGEAFLEEDACGQCGGSGEICGLPCAPPLSFRWCGRCGKDDSACAEPLNPTPQCAAPRQGGCKPCYPGWTGKRCTTPLYSSSCGCAPNRTLCTANEADPSNPTCECAPGYARRPAAPEECARTCPPCDPPHQCDGETGRCVCSDGFRGPSCMSPPCPPSANLTEANDLAALHTCVEELATPTTECFAWVRRALELAALDGGTASVVEPPSSLALASKAPGGPFALAGAATSLAIAVVLLV